jgi:hypothetical protein
MASTPSSLEESNQKAELTKGKVDRGRFEKSPNMPASEWEDHHYRLYHPALPRNVGIIATKDTRYPGTASITISGNKEDANKVGTVNIRHIARQISNDLGVKVYSGLRTTGARVKSGKGPSRVSIPIKESNVEGLEIYHEGKTDVGKQIFHTFFVEHPKLGHKRIYVNTIQHRNKKWEGEIEVGGNDPGKLGPAAVRHVMNHIRQVTGITKFVGKRETGAGPGRMQSIDMLREAEEHKFGKTTLIKIGADKSAEWEDHDYELRHPNIKRPVGITATKMAKWPNSALINIAGNHDEDYNKIGTVEARKIARFMKKDLGVETFMGNRMGGSRKNSPASVKIKIRESVEGLQIKKIHVHFDDDMVQHSYKIFHPNLEHPVHVHATKYFKNPELARMNVGGNDMGKLGPAVVRHVARYIADDMKITQCSGHRCSGAGSGRLQKVTIKERVKDDNDEIYHTKDLEEFSQHLIDKHGAHVEMYWTPEGHVNLQTLIVPKELRNQGIASNVVSDIKKYSNKNKVKIILNAVPLDNSTKSEQLVDFYKSHGFVENKGRNKDYRIAGLDTMYHNHKENKKKK